MFYVILSASHTCITSHIIKIPHQSGTFTTIDETILTHQDHSKSIVYIKLEFTLGIIPSMDLHKRIMTCIYHYGIIPSIFTTLKFPSAPPTHPFSPPHNPWNQWSFNYLHRFSFSRILYSWHHIVGSLFSGLISLSNIYLKFLCVFSWFIAHFF